MSIVNCKVKYLRPKYQNLEEWMNDPNNVYIGRAGIVFINGKRFPQKPSPFHNPYKIGKNGTREQVIQNYRIYIEEKLEKSPYLMKKLIDMDGKNLGCWCYPESCHGDVLLELIQKYKITLIHGDK